MARRTNTRQYLLTLVAAVALVGSGLGVAALAQTDAGDVFTGCLNENSGALRSVAVGFEPAKACNSEEQPITWDRAGPAFEARIAALEERIAELEEPFGTLELFVDCAAGDTVGAALVAAQSHAGPVNIAISGVCEENVGIDRDDVHISGLERSDGIRGADPAASTVTITGARQVEFSNMTLSAGRRGIDARAGSVFTAEGVTIRDMTVSATGVGAGSSAFLSDCSILDNAIWGVTADSGGSVVLENCEISGNSQGLFASHATIVGVDLHVTGNETGVGAHLGGQITIWASVIEENGTGVAGQLNSSIKAGAGTRIANNEFNGVHMSTGSVFVMSDNSIIEGNGGHGIEASGASTVSVGFPNSSIVRGNAGDGVSLGDLSNGEIGDPNSQIVDNGGWGINCAGPSAIASAQSDGHEWADLSGNGSGPTNCP